MKRILVPCDFSDPSIQAFRFALDLARRSGGELFLLNVVELPALYSEAAVLAFERTYLDDTKAEAQKQFKQLIETENNGVKVKSQVEFGGLLPTIRAIALQNEADLLVMGTHGASGLKEYTVGSNTEKIVRSIDIPVVSIKKAPKTVKNIVFPTTLEIDQEELTMRIKELQNLFKASIHVLFINTPASFRRDLATRPALAEFATRFMLKNFTLNIYNDISEEEGIINFSREIKADLVMMRTHGRRGLAHIATGSIAEDVVNHIECPIWTYKIK